jgi:hypothetical protein
MNTKTVRLLFRSAAIFNWSAVLLFLPVPGLAQRFGVDPAPTGTIFELAAFAAIFAFGIGYWRVAGAPEKYEGLVRIGMLAKLLVVAIAYSLCIGGSISLAMAGAASGDLIYGVLFWHYLNTLRAQALP